MVTRVAQKIGLQPDKRDEYLALHRTVWPTVERTLTEAGIRNYSIFLSGSELFA